MLPKPMIATPSGKRAHTRREAAIPATARLICHGLRHAFHQREQQRHDMLGHREGPRIAGIREHYASRHTVEHRTFIAGGQHLDPAQPSGVVTKSCGYIRIIVSARQDESLHIGERILEFLLARDDAEIDACDAL
jgi:hypothetical protein